MSASDSVSSTTRKKRSQSRIFVVEDNDFVREALISLIASQTDLLCCGQADTLEGMRAGVHHERPDLVLTDLRLKDGESFELIKALKLEFPDIGILVISQRDEILYAERALQAGASGYLMKVEASQELLPAVHTVLSGKVYLSHAMSVRLVQRVLKPGLDARTNQTKTALNGGLSSANSTESPNRPPKARRKIS
jgi:DNA-binding NarL/FixJ family response regulator